ncbi:ABC1 kinase family protein [Microbacterium imperiale]|uniref:ABC1 kinase family protein n=1 Tax=Microbacterium imperiale TaxID=33884 RepID=UPI001AE7FE18|nr:AarF/ABC1/UbiB kinase family protein [Microbacterium imperiale]MBP2422135.1 ubiquinone biosynthesis protein [Microbacterium imperiale]MDS0200294.1 AarF/ABC1/UbiB kinase family protein [Microbacterium imperiale]
MPEWLLFAIGAVVFAVAATWLAKRALEARVGWVRGPLVSLVVFVVFAPLGVWVLRQAGIMRGSGVLVDNPITIGFVLLVLAWMFAIVLIVLIALELMWPARVPVGPIRAIRGALHRRRRAMRYARIVAIASRHGLGGMRSESARAELPRALAATLDDAGVTFVKLGQILSTRSDLLPAEITRALATLQMDTTPIPWPEAKSAIETQLGRPLDLVFTFIDETPLAAASVGQVHTAQLRDGTDVVVKIQRPKARAEVATDLDIIERAAADLERRTTWAKDVGASALAAQFAVALREELDYRVEVANMEMLRDSMTAADARAVRIPDVYPELCTEQLIVMEHVRGIPFSRLPAPGEPGSVAPEDATAIADAVLDVIVGQVALRGVFHADLHPGNLILQPDGIVALIDFGSVGIVEKSLRRLLLPLLVALHNEDDSGATDAVLMLVKPRSGSAVDVAALQHDIGVLLTRLHNSRADQHLFSALIDVLRHHRLALPPGLLLAFRTLGAVEGTLRRLDPGYDMIKRALSRAPHYALRMGDPRTAALSAQVQLQLGRERLRDLPRRVDGILHDLESGELTVRLRALESPDDRSWVESLTGRLTTTVVGATLVIVGVMLGVADHGPLLTETVSVFPFLGSIVGLGGLLLLLRSLRSALVRRESSGG